MKVQVTSAIPVALSHPAAALYDGHILLTSGQAANAESTDTFGAQQDVYAARVRQDGTMEPWRKIYTMTKLHAARPAFLTGDNLILGPAGAAQTTLTGEMSSLHLAGGPKVIKETKFFAPRNEANPGMFAFSNFLYLIGGNAGTLTTAYRGEMDGSGAVSKWQLIDANLPFQFVGTPQQIVAKDDAVYVYVAGTVNKIWWSKITTSGTFFKWQSFTVPHATAFAVNDRPLTVFNGKLMLWGGADTNGAGSWLSRVCAIDILSDGSLNNFRDVAYLSTASSGQAVVTSDTRSWVLGGATGASARTSDVQHADLSKVQKY